MRKREDEERIPEGNKKTAISDEEKERVKNKQGTRKLSKAKWIKLLNNYGN